MGALYVVAFGFLLPTLMEFLLVSFPYRVGSVQWRFGAVGLIFNTVLLPPLVGLALIMFAAVQLDHRRVARTVSILALVVAAVLVLLLPFFLLDFLQLRKLVNPQALRAFDLTSLKATLTGLVMLCVAIALGISGLRATRLPKLAPAKRTARKSANTVVVGGGAAEATQG
jgi:hypothetical protein